MVWIALAVAAVVFMLIKRKSSIIEVGTGVPPGPGAAPPQAPAGGPMDLSEVHRMAAAGQLIDAIKLLRGITGMSLVQAKDAVDLIARSPHGKISVTVSTNGGQPHQVDPAVFARIKSLIEQGHIIEAIRVAREASGSDLKTAKDLIDRIKQDPPNPA